MTLFGIDFTSAPRPAKGIVVAAATATAAGESDDPLEPVRVHSLQRLESFDAFDRWLQTDGPWVGAFDLPFGLPRELMAEWKWCLPRGCTGQADPGWPAVIERFAALERADMVNRLRAFCAVRPVGDKFAHRRTDGPAGSSPSMKWVNPPVAQMMHAGAPRLLRAGVHLPGLGVAGDPRRVALEGYPGLVARALIGRAPYKTDDRKRQSAGHAVARVRMVEALERGAADAQALASSLPPAGASASSPPPAGAAAPAVSRRPAFVLEHRLQLDPSVRQRCLDDGSGDALDAVLCVALAAWAWRRRASGWGLPADLDPLEGWIVGA